MAEVSNAAGSGGWAGVEQPAAGTTAESVALARRAVASVMTAFPARLDLLSLSATLERLLPAPAAASSPPVDPPAASLQRAAGHLGVLADEADVASEPFGTEGGRAVRRAAIALRQAAAAHDPSSAVLALRHSMVGRLEALSTFPLAVREPATVVGRVSHRLTTLRTRAVAGEDRITLAADMRRVAEILAVEVIPFHREGSPGATLVRSRIVLFLRSADWFQHPAHGPQREGAG